MPSRSEAEAVCSKSRVAHRLITSASRKSIRSALRANFEQTAPPSLREGTPPDLGGESFRRLLPNQVYTIRCSAGEDNTSSTAAWTWSTVTDSMHSGESGDEATIARTRIALKRILDDAVFHAPGPPPSRIRGTPYRDSRRTDCRCQVHRSRIVSKVNAGAANQFAKFGNRKAQQDDGTLNLLRDFEGVGFLSGACRDDDGQIPRCQLSGDGGKACRLPSASWP